LKLNAIESIFDSKEDVEYISSRQTSVASLSHFVTRSRYVGLTDKSIECGIASALSLCYVVQDHYKSAPADGIYDINTGSLYKRRYQILSCGTLVETCVPQAITDD
jgi:hypothetical protein